MFLSTFIVVHNHTSVYFIHCVLCAYTNTLENGGKRFKRSKLKEHGYLAADRSSADCPKVIGGEGCK